MYYCKNRRNEIRACPGKIKTRYFQPHAYVILNDLFYILSRDLHFKTPIKHNFFFNDLLVAFMGHAARAPQRFLIDHAPRANG